VEGLSLHQFIELRGSEAERKETPRAGKGFRARLSTPEPDPGNAGEGSERNGLFRAGTRLFELPALFIDLYENPKRERMD
jgi:hypothetical protein